jgi:hypothetical protein
MGRKEGAPISILAEGETKGTRARIERFSPKSAFGRPDMADEPIVAIGLLTSSDLERLGETFTRLWPIDRSTDFSELLQAIDEAEERYHRTIRTEI